VVTNKYNTRSLPNILFGSTAGILAGNTRYNVLGEMTDLNLGNGTKTTFDYWGIDNAEDYYGRLYEIQTVNASSSVMQDVRHVWDAGGNLTQRQNVVASETENFTYDFLDRLTGVSGPHTESFSCTKLGISLLKTGLITATPQSLTPLLRWVIPAIPMMPMAI
jgi:hypothetical protein